MEVKEILQEIRSLRQRVEGLSREIDRVTDSVSVEGMLKMRGVKVFRKNPTDRLFFTPDLPAHDKDRFYERMKRYSFRLVLRDMIKLRNGFRVQDLTHYCSLKVVRGYCDLLQGMGAIVKEGKVRYRTGVSPLYSFGPTLEWFISEVFIREFASPSVYGVSLKKTASGGDYDVIASWNRRLVYAEVKSSPPKGVETREVSTFFSRIEDLLPDVAIFFDDTQLRMKDKLVVMFEEELGRRSASTPYRVERLVEELFHIQHRIYIVNSRKDVIENLRICLRDYLEKTGDGFRFPGPS